MSDDAVRGLPSASSGALNSAWSRVSESTGRRGAPNPTIRTLRSRPNTSLLGRMSPWTMPCLAAASRARHTSTPTIRAWLGVSRRPLSRNSLRDPPASRSATVYTYRSPSRVASPWSYTVSMQG